MYSYVTAGSKKKKTRYLRSKNRTACYLRVNIDKFQTKKGEGGGGGGGEAVFGGGGEFRIGDLVPLVCLGFGFR